jgi:choline transporter-like protein 2/4/5
MLLMFFPTVSTVFQILVCGWFIITMTLVQTTKAESLDVALGKVVNTSAVEFLALGVAEASEGSVDPIEGLRGIVSNAWYPTATTVIVLYGFFVLIQYVQGISWATMSGVVYYWFYFVNCPKHLEDPKEKTKIPIFKSLARTVFYHSGSVAFAAFIIALCDLLRAGAAYVEKQMGPTKNALVKLAFKVLQCCLYCLKKTVKFVSYYGLVFVSCKGESFCMACYHTFFFFLMNPGQVAINGLVTFLLKLIAILSMPLVCGVGFYFLLDYLSGTDAVSSSLNAMYPGAIIWVLAAVMTMSLMTVFECVVTTIFVCCFEDKKNASDAKYEMRMSDRLADAFHIKRKKAGESDEAKADVKQSL